MAIIFSEELKDEEKTYITFEITDDQDWVYMDWIGYQDEKRIKKGMNHAVKLLDKYKLHKILNNNNHHHGGYPEFIYKWIEKDWLPKAKKKGLQYTATVLSPKVFSRLSAMQLKVKFTSDNYRNFESIEEAKNWLNSM